MLEIFALVLIIIAGLVFGSFANVLIYRIPKSKSIIKPRSFCPECGSEILWYDNIPIISWIILKGKCRRCKSPISVKYPLVEALSAIIFVVSYILFGFSIENAVATLFLYMLLVVSFIDLEARIIPNKIIYPAILVTISFSIVFYLIGKPLLPLLGRKSLAISFFSGLTVFSLILMIDFFGKIVYKKEGIGAGDIKLSFLMGIILGYHVFLAVFFAFLFGAAIGLIVLRIRKKRMNDDIYIPMGPFLSLGSFITLVSGEKILNWYLRFLS